MELNPYPTNTESDIPKMIMDGDKNGRWIIPFKKFGMAKVKK